VRVEQPAPATPNRTAVFIGTVLVWAIRLGGVAFLLFAAFLAFIFLRVAPDRQRDVDDAERELRRLTTWLSRQTNAPVAKPPTFSREEFRRKTKLTSRFALEARGPFDDVVQQYAARLATRNWRLRQHDERSARFTRDQWLIDLKAAPPVSPDIPYRCEIVVHWSG